MIQGMDGTSVTPGKGPSYFPTVSYFLSKWWTYPMSICVHNLRGSSALFGSEICDIVASSSTLKLTMMN